MHPKQKSSVKLPNMTPQRSTLKQSTKKSRTASIIAYSHKDTPVSRTQFRGIVCKHTAPRLRECSTYFDDNACSCGTAPNIRSGRHERSSSALHHFDESKIIGIDRYTGFNTASKARLRRKFGEVGQCIPFSKAIDV